MKSLLYFLFTSLLIAQNINISQGFFWQGEPYLIQNAKNPDNLVIAWMGYSFAAGSGIAIRVITSNDRGKSWNPPVFIPHVVTGYTSADPSLASDTSGNIHLAFIDYDYNTQAGAVYYTRSSDGGTTWNNPVEVINHNSDPGKNPIDRPWIAVNPAGNIIAVTSVSTKNTPLPNRPYVSFSQDGGQTFSRRYIDTVGASVGTAVAQPTPFPVADNDTFKFVFPSYLPSQNILPQFFLATTPNAGASFSYQPIISGNAFQKNDTAKAYYKLFQNPGNSKHLILAFAYAPYGDIDLFFTETFDNGNTWSNIARVNDDPVGNGAIQDLFWGDFDADGDFVLTWRDRRNGTPGTVASAYEIYAAFKDKNSSSFSENFPVTDSLLPYDTLVTKSGNDFMSCVLYEDTLYAVWGDTRTGTLQIWFSKIHARSPASPVKKLIYSERAPVLYPNPSRGEVNILFDEPLERWEIFSIDGKKIKEIHSKNKAKLNLPQGEYFVKIHLKSGKIFIKRLRILF